MERRNLLGSYIIYMTSFGANCCDGLFMSCGRGRHRLIQESVETQETRGMTGRDEIFWDQPPGMYSC